MEAEEKETELDHLDINVISYLKKRPKVVREEIIKSAEGEIFHKKTAGKKPPPIRLFPTIRLKNRGILSSQVKELYETKKELTERLDVAIKSLVRHGERLTDCEKIARALMKSAPKKFRVKSAELKEIVRTLYESYLISFEIKIEPKDWEIFVAAFRNPVENTFMNQLEDSLDICVASKLSEQEEKKKARGPNRKRIDYINHIKDKASRRYAVIKFICELAPDQWPTSFNQFIEKYKSYRKYFEKKGIINPELFTAFLLSQNYKQSMEKNNIYKFFDITLNRYNLKGFRRYLDDNTVKIWENSIRYQFSCAVKKGNAKYLTKKGQKYPLPYSYHLAQKDDMEPCDQKGNIREVPPCIDKGREILDRYLLDKDVTLVLPNPAN